MGRGEKMEAAAEEKDSGAVVQEIAEAPGIGLEGLDFGVENLRNRVGYGVEREVEQSLEVLGQHLRDFLHFRQLGLHDPAFPLLEVILGLAPSRTFPELPEILLHCPGTAGFQVCVLEFLELRGAAFRQVFRIEKENMLHPLVNPLRMVRFKFP